MQWVFLLCSICRFQTCLWVQRLHTHQHTENSPPFLVLFCAFSIMVISAVTLYSSFHVKYIVTCAPHPSAPQHTHTHISAYAPGRCKIISCVPSLKHSSLKVGEGNRERKTEEEKGNRKEQSVWQGKGLQVRAHTTYVFFRVFRSGDSGLCCYNFWEHSNSLRTLKIRNRI